MSDEAILKTLRELPEWEAVMAAIGWPAYYIAEREAQFHAHERHSPGEIEMRDKRLKFVALLGELGLQAYTQGLAAGKVEAMQEWEAFSAPNRRAPVDSSKFGVIPND